MCIGVPLPNSIAIIIVSSLAQTLIGSRRLRAFVPWRSAFTAAGIRLVVSVLGLLVLKKLTTLTIADIKLVVGIVLCLAVGIQSVRVRPVEALHWAWGALAFSASGFLAGLCGMGGPPLVLWALAHDWPSKRTRGFLFATFATSIPGHIVLLWITFGADTVRSSGLGFLLLPAVFAGAAVGLPLGNRIDKQLLRRIVYLILLAIGLNAIIPTLVARLG
jgi:uncharacterized membrane protein YfcA